MGSRNIFVSKLGSCNKLGLRSSAVVFGSHEGSEHLRLDLVFLYLSINPLYLLLRLSQFTELLRLRIHTVLC